MRRQLLSLVTLLAAAPLAIALVPAQPTASGLREPQDRPEQSRGVGVHTAAQSAAGRAAYQASCASCHMPDLAGRSEAPPLAGPNFMNSWRSRTTRDLFEFIQSTMPPDGSNLTADQYLAIVAFILESNGASAGVTV